MRPPWFAVNKEVTPDHLGLIPAMLDDEDERKAAQQFDAHYDHGGGWNPFKGHTLDFDTMELSYPGDPPLKPLAFTKLRDEIILMYPYAWVVIIQPDKSYEICRMD